MKGFVTSCDVRSGLADVPVAGGAERQFIPQCTPEATVTIRLSGGMTVEDLRALQEGSVEIVPAGGTAILEPGEKDRPVYVFKVAQRISMEDKARIEDSWNTKMGPNSPKLLILDNGAELEVVGDGNKPVEVDRENWLAEWIRPPDDVRDDAVPRPFAIGNQRCLPSWVQLLAANQWLAMAYAAGLLGIVQAGFWIVRWWG